MPPASPLTSGSSTSGTPPGAGVEAKVKAVLRLWSLALALSAALVAAGERWPAPLAPDGPPAAALVAGLVFGIPALVALILVSRRGVVGHRGESTDRAQGER